MLLALCFTRDGNPSNFWTGFGFGFLQEKMADSPWIRILIFGGFRNRISDSSNILKGFLKKLSATYVLKINFLGVLYNSLPRFEQDLKRYYI